MVVGHTRVGQGQTRMEGRPQWAYTSSTLPCPVAKIHSQAVRIGGGDTHRREDEKHILV